VPPRGTITSRSLGWSDSALQPDGRIVTVGWTEKGRARMVAIRRFEDGRIDPSFARPVIPIGANAEAGLVTIQPDGKILMVGSASPEFSPQRGFDSDLALVRLLPDGQFDPSFGSGGIARTDLGGDDTPTAMAVEPDGGILVAGISGSSIPFSPDSQSSFAVARYGPSGELDAGFGAGGKSIFSFGGRAGALALARLPSGDIAVGGFHSTNPLGVGAPEVAQARLTPSGELDPAFGQGGKAITPLVDPAAVGARLVLGGVSAMGFTREGQLLAAGQALIRTRRRTFDGTGVARFGVDGGRDSSFGVGGVSLIGFRKMSTAGEFSLASDGSMVLAGGGTKPTGLRLVRLSASGSLDRSFGRAGAARTRLTGFFTIARGLILDPAGRMVVTGWSEIQEERPGLAVLARYQANGRLDKSFGPRQKRHRKHGRRHR
jgi:uncharacterized delta-60 repeat protein